MITMTDAEVLELLQDFLNTSKSHIEALAEAFAGWQARAEAAEDRAEAAEQKLREIAQFTLKTNTRAEAAEAECERLREQVAELTAALRLAREYVVKGNEQGAYTGCALSGETVLARINWAAGR